MSKKETRQHGIRNKLFAAIAMLLVSSIMVVSTTYAWFTLSTAPEVQGITTTVGANGNLEIALSPAGGIAEANTISSAVGDSEGDWTVKNLTWGNLLDLSDESYGLADLTLLPARLNYTGTGADAKLGDNPLSTPVYGADGRISELENDKAIIGGRAAGIEGFTAGGAYGVRAIGTSSSMSPEQAAFNSNISKIGTYMGTVREKAKASLTANGSTLASMAVAHASAGSADSGNYASYVPSLRAVITSLEAANNDLEQAIRAGILAAAASNANQTIPYETVKSAVEGTTELTALWTTFQNYGFTFDGGNPLGSVYAKWEDVSEKLAAADAALDTLEAKVAASETVAWTEASSVLTHIMETNSVKINDKDLNTFKQLVQWGTATDEVAEANDYTEAQRQEGSDFISTLTKGIVLKLGTGSGVYADLAEAAGNIEAEITIAEVVYGNIRLTNVGATIKTDIATTPLLTTLRTTLSTIGAPGASENASSVIDVNYGYVVDFMFRTNATGSSLLLQTDAAQRVYEDSSSTATMGHGSTMTFRTGELDVLAVQSLMDCIRVAFIDPNTNAIFGIGALDMATATQELITAASENTPAVYDVTAKLYLYEYSNDATTGVMALGTKSATAALCTLPANTATAVSAMVYLDGDYVDNADVADAESSMTGKLNLQFASSADLVPMENAGLKNMVGADDEQIPTTENTLYTIDTTAVADGDTVTITAVPGGFSAETTQQIVEAALATANIPTTKTVDKTANATFSLPTKVEVDAVGTVNVTYTFTVTSESTTHTYAIAQDGTTNTWIITATPVATGN